MVLVLLEGVWLVDRAGCAVLEERGPVLVSDGLALNMVVEKEEIAAVVVCTGGPGKSNRIYVKITMLKLHLPR